MSTVLKDTHMKHIFSSDLKEIERKKNFLKALVGNIHAKDLTGHFEKRKE